MSIQRTLQIADIPWLRLSARATGAAAVPEVIARKLLAGGFVERDRRRDCLVITPRGKLALTMLA